jgi:hypothetical protein
MPRSPNNTTPKRNSTEERLRATPFDDVEKMDAEEKAIRAEAWRRLTHSKVVEELLTKPEFKHVLEELRSGLSCDLNNNAKDNVYRIFSEGHGLKLLVNTKFSESLGEHQVRFFQGVVQAGIEGYGALYMQVKGMLSRPSVSKEEFEGAASPKKG